MQGREKKNEQEGVVMDKPGENPETHIAQLLQNWGMLQTEIKALFDKRNKHNVTASMEKGIEYFIEYMFLTNELPDLSANQATIDYNSLILKPINITERLHFLKLRPNIYPSFVQLTELFEEQQKHYAKAQAIGRAKS